MMQAGQPDEAAIASGEFVFTQGDFRALAALVEREAGIMLPDGKAALVYSRLSRRLRALGLDSFRAYRARVEEDAAERQALISAMTTNVTRFFREPHHFAHLEQKVLPELAAAARAGARVRLWSSACSSGEEAYSIALTLLKVMPDAARHDVLILASDLDPEMIAIAQDGVYPAARLGDIPLALRDRGIETGADRFRVSDAVRGLLRFRTLNLLKPWPIRAPFQAIFCRNVMIYFDAATQAGLWDRFAGLLPMGGHLYIGHSERIASPRFALAGQTAYRRQA